MHQNHQTTIYREYIVVLKDDTFTFIFERFRSENQDVIRDRIINGVHIVTDLQIFAAKLSGVIAVSLWCKNSNILSCLEAYHDIAIKKTIKMKVRLRVMI